MLKHGCCLSASSTFGAFLCLNGRWFHVDPPHGLALGFLVDIHCPQRE